MISNSLGKEHMTGFHGKETLFHKTMKVLDKLRKYQLLKTDNNPCSQLFKNEGSY
jgi:hypothetical protein